MQIWTGLKPCSVLSKKAGSVFSCGLCWYEQFYVAYSFLCSGLCKILSLLQDISPCLAEEEKVKGLQASLDEARGMQGRVFLNNSASPGENILNSADDLFPELNASLVSPTPGANESEVPHPAEQLRLHAYFKTPDSPAYLPLTSRRVGMDGIQWPTIATMRAYVEDSNMRSVKGAN
jgi:hypothetical protein